MVQTAERRAKKDPTRQLSAQHRPALKRRNYRHDTTSMGDLFSGFGGLTQGVQATGKFDCIVAANHRPFKVEVHEANHPYAEHFVADLVNPDRGDYYRVQDLPKVDFLCAGVSCVNHSLANSKKAYRRQQSLFDLDDPGWEERVTKSELDRATANCVLHYAAHHHPRLILVECTCELTSWGAAIPGTNIGDGSAYRWWLKEFGKLGYRHKVMYLNSMFFEDPAEDMPFTPQSRNRYYVAFSDNALPVPDLDHRPPAWCGHCGEIVEAQQRWRTGVSRTGRVNYGEQYDYRCPRCVAIVAPPRGASYSALDLTDLGTLIADRERPLADSTIGRVERCIVKMRDFPLIVMQMKAERGKDVTALEPAATQTSQQTAALVTPAALSVMAGHTFERAGSDCRTRSLADPAWTQHATNSLGLVTGPQAIGVMPFRKGNASGLDYPIGTQTAVETFSLVSAGVMPYRNNTHSTGLHEPIPTQSSECIPALISAAFVKQNGGANDTAPHHLGEAANTITARDTTALVTTDWFENADEIREYLRTLTPDQCRLRPLGADEVGRLCGFRSGEQYGERRFKVWGSIRDQVDGYGNAVSPNVGRWIAERLAAIL